MNVRFAVLALFFICLALPASAATCRMQNGNILIIDGNRGEQRFPTGESVFIHPVDNSPMHFVYVNEDIAAKTGLAKGLWFFTGKGEPDAHFDFELGDDISAASLSPDGRHILLDFSMTVDIAHIFTYPGFKPAFEELPYSPSSESAGVFWLSGDALLLNAASDALEERQCEYEACDFKSVVHVDLAAKKITPLVTGDAQCDRTVLALKGDELTVRSVCEDSPLGWKTYKEDRPTRDETYSVKELLGSAK